MSQAGGVFSTRVVAGLRAADQALDCARQAPAWQCADAEVETALELLDHLDARSAALRSTLLTQAEERGLKQRTGAPSTERWLADRFRCSRLEAGRRLRLAAKHVGQPAVHAALGAGTVTVEQAGVLAAGLDAVDAVPGVTDTERVLAAEVLVGQAASLDPHGLAAAATAIVENLTRLPSTDDPADAAALERERERAEKEAQERERNSFRLGTRNGRTRGVIDFGTLGEATAHAWTRVFGKPTPGVDGFEDTRDTSERLGDAIVDLLALAAAGHQGRCCNTTPDVGDGPPTAATEPALFGDLEDPGGVAEVGELEDVDADEADDEDDARDQMPAEPVDPGCTHRGSISPVALLTITVTLAELRAGLPDAGRLPTGATVSAATLRQLACDALVVPAVMNGPSEVLDLGRTRRLHNLAQRRGLALRDRGCAAPGCDRPPQACHPHHNLEWIKGGPTDLDNGSLLCAYHHRMVHRQGWRVRLAANGFPEFIPPATIDPEQRPRQHMRYQLLASQRFRP